MSKEARKGVSKIIVMVVAISLVMGGVIGGTAAWLIAKPDPIVNTFTYGNINITLTETDTGLDGDTSANTNMYKMMPGSTIEKDPVVTVLQGSESNWLFVKLEETANFDTFFEDYYMGDGWTALPGETGVYFREVLDSDVQNSNQRYEVIKDSKVVVKSTVTKDDFDALDDSTLPKLTITAYAVQKSGFDTAEKAWDEINGAGTTTNP